MKRLGIDPFSLLLALTLSPTPLSSSFHSHRTTVTHVQLIMEVDPLPETIAHHTFTDCLSRPAVSIYRGLNIGSETEVIVPPPLFSIQVYVTYALPADAPMSTREAVAQRFANLVFEEWEPWDRTEALVRFDIYFHPGASDVDIMRHYHAERKAMPHYSTTLGCPEETPRGFAVVLPSENLEADGADLISFDRPADDEGTDDNEAADASGLELYRAHIGPEETDPGLGGLIGQQAESEPDWGRLEEEYLTLCGWSDSQRFPDSELQYAPRSGNPRL
ncbi:hypothetical protein GGR56DRAFT_148283 [Xylariaceae sp. FL0804]|nr:hypothetical protein GGR56DRAFT_148283 [Xylariaceae sp. FL0804]